MAGSRLKYLSIKFECAALAASLIFGAVAFCGCNHVRHTGGTHALADEEVKPGSPTEASPTPTPSPTPDPKKKAVELAEIVGLKEEDLKGQYELFGRYSAVVCGNEKINGYREYLYKFFPIVAQYLKPENEEYFFGKLKTLEIIENHNDGVDGQYDRVTNRIDLEPDMKTKTGEDLYSSVLYHELMHFVDINVGGDALSGVISVMKDGTLRKYGDLNYAERNQVETYLTTYFTEGGAENYTSEYFTSSPNSYLVRVRFMVGLKYIFGNEKIDNMFFSNDSDWQFVEILKDCEFTNEEIIKVCETMRNTDSGIKDPKTAIDPREVLIRLYIKYKGAEYEKDKAFCFILGSMNEDSLNKIPSDYKKFYSKLKCLAQEEILQIWGYVTNEVGDASKKMGFAGMPGPMYINGELKVVVSAAPIDGEYKDYKAVIVDYDFETGYMGEFSIVDEWAPKSLEGVNIPDITGTSDTTDTDGTTETTG